MVKTNLKDLHEANRERARENVTSVWDDITDGNIWKATKKIFGGIGGAVDAVQDIRDGKSIKEVGSNYAKKRLDEFQLAVDTASTALDYAGDGFRMIGDEIEKTGVFDYDDDDRQVTKTAKDIARRGTVGAFRGIDDIFDTASDLPVTVATAYDKKWNVSKGFDSSQNTRGEIAGHGVNDALNLWIGGSMLKTGARAIEGGITKAISSGYNNVTKGLLESQGKSWLGRGYGLARDIAIAGTNVLRQVPTTAVAIKEASLGTVTQLYEPANTIAFDNFDEAEVQNQLKNLGWDTDAAGPKTIVNVGESVNRGNDIKNLDQFNQTIAAAGVRAFENKADAKKFLEETYRVGQTKTLLSDAMETLVNEVEAKQSPQGPAKFSNEKVDQVSAQESREYKTTEIKNDIAGYGNEVDIKQYMNDMVQFGKEVTNSTLHILKEEYGYNPVIALNQSSSQYIQLTKDYTIGRIGANTQDLLQYADDPRVKEYLQKVNESYQTNLVYMTAYALEREKIHSSNPQLSAAEIHEEADKNAIMITTGKDNLKDALTDFRNKTQLNGASLESQGSRILSEVKGGRSNVGTIGLNRVAVGLSQVRGEIEENVFQSGRYIGNLSEEMEVPGERAMDKVFATLGDKGGMTIATTVGMVALNFLRKAGIKRIPKKQLLTRAFVGEGLDEVIEEAAAVINTNAEGDFMTAAVLGGIIGVSGEMAKAEISAGGAMMNPNLVGKDADEWVNDAIGHDKNKFIDDVIEETAKVRLDYLSKKSRSKAEESEYSVLSNNPTTNQLKALYRKDIKAINDSIVEYGAFAEEIIQEVESQTVPKPDIESTYIKNDIRNTVGHIALINVALNRDPSNENLLGKKNKLIQIFNRQKDYYNKTINSQRNFNNYLKESYGKSFTTVRDYKVYQERKVNNLGKSFIEFVTKDIGSESSKSLANHYKNNRSEYDKAISNPRRDKKLDRDFAVVDDAYIEKYKDSYDLIERKRTQATINGKKVEFIDFISADKEYQVRIIRDLKTGENIIGNRRSPRNPYTPIESLEFEKSASHKIADGLSKKYAQHAEGQMFYINKDGEISIHTDASDDTKNDDGISEKDAAVATAELAKEANKKKNKQAVEEAREKVIEIVDKENTTPLLKHILDSAETFSYRLIDTLVELKRIGSKAASIVEDLINLLLDKAIKVSQDTYKKLLPVMEDLSVRFSEAKKEVDEKFQEYVNDFITYASERPLVVAAGTAAAAWIRYKGSTMGMDVQSIVSLGAMMGALKVENNDDIDGIKDKLIVDEIIRQEVDEKKEELIEQVNQEGYNTVFGRFDRKAKAINQATQFVWRDQAQELYQTFIDGIARVINPSEEEMAEIQKVMQARVESWGESISNINIYKHLAQDFPTLMDKLADQGLSANNDNVIIGGEGIRIINLLKSADPIPFNKGLLKNPVQTIKMIEASEDASMHLQQLDMELLYGFIANDPTARRNYFYIMNQIGSESATDSASPNDIIDRIKHYTNKIYNNYLTKKNLTEWTKRRITGAKNVSYQYNKKTKSVDEILLRTNPFGIITVGKAKTGKSQWANQYRDKKGYKVLSISDYDSDIGGAKAMESLIKDISGFKPNSNQQLIVDISNTKKSQRKQIVTAMRNRGMQVSAVMFNTLNDEVITESEVKITSENLKRREGEGLDRTLEDIIYESERKKRAIAANVDQEYVEGETMPTPGELMAEGIRILDKDLNEINMEVLSSIDNVNVIHASADTRAYNIETTKTKMGQSIDSITINIAHFTPSTLIEQSPTLAAALLIKLDPSLIYVNGTEGTLENGEIIDWTQDPGAIIYNAKAFNVIPNNTTTISDILSDTNLELLSMPAAERVDFATSFAADRIANIIGRPVSSDIFDQGFETLKNMLRYVAGEKVDVTWNDLDRTNITKINQMVEEGLIKDEKEAEIERVSLAAMELGKILMGVYHSGTRKFIMENEVQNANVANRIKALTTADEFVDDYIDTSKKQYVVINADRWAKPSAKSKALSLPVGATIILSNKSGQLMYADKSLGPVKIDPSQSQVHSEVNVTIPSLDPDVEIAVFDFRFNNKKIKFSPDGKIWNIPLTNKMLDASSVEQRLKMIQEFNEGIKEDSGNAAKARYMLELTKKNTEQGSLNFMDSNSAGLLIDSLLTVINELREGEDSVTVEVGRGSQKITIRSIFRGINESRKTVGLDPINQPGAFEAFEKAIKDGTIDDLTIRAAFVAGDLSQVETAHKRIQYQLGYEFAGEKNTLSRKAIENRILEFMAFAGWGNATSNAALWVAQLAEALQENTHLNQHLMNVLMYRSAEAELELKNFLNTQIKAEAPYLSTSREATNETKEMTMKGLLNLLFGDLDMEQSILDAFRKISYSGTTFVQTSRSEIQQGDEDTYGNVTYSMGTMSYENFTKSKELQYLLVLNSFLAEGTRELSGLRDNGNYILMNGLRAIANDNFSTEAEPGDPKKVIKDYVISTVKSIMVFTPEVEGNTSRSKSVRAATDFINSVLNKILTKKNTSFVPFIKAMNIVDSEGSLRRGWENTISNIVDGIVKNSTLKDSVTLSNRLYSNDNIHVVVGTAAIPNMRENAELAGEISFTGMEERILGEEFMSAWNANMEGGMNLLDERGLTEIKSFRREILGRELISLEQKIKQFKMTSFNQEERKAADQVYQSLHRKYASLFDVWEYDKKGKISVPSGEVYINEVADVEKLNIITDEAEIRGSSPYGLDNISMEAKEAMVASVKYQQVVGPWLQKRGGDLSADPIETYNKFKNDTEAKLLKEYSETEESISEKVDSGLIGIEEADALSEANEKMMESRLQKELYIPEQVKNSIKKHIATKEYTGNRAVNKSKEIQMGEQIKRERSLEEFIKNKRKESLKEGKGNENLMNEWLLQTDLDSQYVSGVITDDEYINLSHSIQPEESETRGANGFARIGTVDTNSPVFDVEVKAARYNSKQISSEKNIELQQEPIFLFDSDGKILSDSDYDRNVIIIDHSIDRIVLLSGSRRSIVFPKDGLIPNREKMKSASPHTYEYIQNKLYEAFGYDEEEGFISDEDALLKYRRYLINKNKKDLNGFVEEGDYVYNEDTDQYEREGGELDGVYDDVMERNQFSEEMYRDKINRRDNTSYKGPGFYEFIRSDKAKNILKKYNLLEEGSEISDANINLLLSVYGLGTSSDPIDIKRYKAAMEKLLEDKNRAIAMDEVYKEYQKKMIMMYESDNESIATDPLVIDNELINDLYTNC